MTGLSICVGGWLVLNAVIFAALMLRRGRPVLRDQLFRWAVDVARAVAAILDDPAPHIGQIYDLTGPESADLDHYARAFSEALGRTIRYRDVPLAAWSEGLQRMRFPEHVVSHLSAMTELNRLGRYDRMTDTMFKLTGEVPTNMRDFVKLHAAEFKQRGQVHS